MEYCKHGTLDDVLHTIRNGAHKYQIEPATTLKWMRQVAAGLRMCGKRPQQPHQLLGPHS